METPKIAIIITTYDKGDGVRTPLLCRTVQHLLKNLQYPNLLWIIADDGSPDITHLGSVTKLLADCDHVMLDAGRAGVGVSKNKALNYAWNAGCTLVLMLEDDWELARPLDLYPFIKLLENDTIGMVRMGYLGGELEANYEAWEGISFWRLKRGSGVYVYSGQVSLRHKRFYDNCGYHPEGVSPGEEELEFCKRYNACEGAPDIVWPAKFACEFNQGAFVNIGTGEASLNAVVPEG